MQNQQIQGIQRTNLLFIQRKLQIQQAQLTNIGIATNAESDQITAYLTSDIHAFYHFEYTSFDKWLVPLC